MNSGDPDQTPHFAASGLGFHCLPMSHKKDVRFIWVKTNKGVLRNQLVGCAQNV